jgi:hypothetical protein
VQRYFFKCVKCSPKKLVKVSGCGKNEPNFHGLQLSFDGCQSILVACSTVVHFLKKINFWGKLYKVLINYYTI